MYYSLLLKAWCSGKVLVHRFSAPLNSAGCSRDCHYGRRRRRRYRLRKCLGRNNLPHTMRREQACALPMQHTLQQPTICCTSHCRDTRCMNGRKPQSGIQITNSLAVACGTEDTPLPNSRRVNHGSKDISSMHRRNVSTKIIIRSDSSLALKFWFDLLKLLTVSTITAVELTANLT